MSIENGRLRLTGHAYVNALGAASPDVQQLELGAVRPGARRALRMRLSPARLATMPVRRRDLEPRIQWSGFKASLSPAALLVHGDWEIFASVRSGGLRRRRAVFVVDDPALVRTVDMPAGDDVLMQATVSADGRVMISVTPQWVRVELHRRIGAHVLELSGRARRSGRGARADERRDRRAPAAGARRLGLPSADRYGRAARERLGDGDRGRRAPAGALARRGTVGSRMAVRRDASCR
jgi:hypothetical protein